MAATFTGAAQKLDLPGRSALNSGALVLWNVKGGSGGVNTYCISPAIWKQDDQISIAASFAPTAEEPANGRTAID